MARDVFDEEFILQLFKLALTEKEYFDVLHQNMKKEYFPEEKHQKLWKTICTEVNLSETGKIPNIAIFKQQYRSDKEVRELLSDIQEVEPVNKDDVISELEGFLKQNMFVESYNQIGDSYNKGKKDAAYSIFVQKAEEFTRFSLKEKVVTKIFADYQKRVVDRELAKIEGGKRERIPTGIDELDSKINNGFSTGEFIVILGDSGSGKSFFGNHLGVNAARRGYHVCHIQAEGTKEQVEGRYDSLWTGTKYFDIKENNVSPTKDAKIRKIIDSMAGEIHVETYETFGNRTVADVRNTIRSLKKKYDIRYVILDYMDLIDPDDGHKYTPSEERHRQQKVAKACKNIAVEENVVFVTFTQSSSLNPADLENPDFVIKRFNLAEDKGKIRPVDFLITINRTSEERKQKTARLYVDKAREHESGMVITIAQNLRQSRFYDRVQTLKRFFNPDDHDGELD